jgi:hypothetical protein
MIAAVVLWIRSGWLIDSCCWGHKGLLCVECLTPRAGQFETRANLNPDSDSPLRLQSVRFDRAGWTPDKSDTTPTTWYLPQGRIFGSENGAFDCARVKIIKGPPMADMLSGRAAIPTIAPPSAPTGLIVRVPFLLVTLVLASPFALISTKRITRLLRKRSRRKRGRCSACGYDLRAHKSGDRCPECGTPIPAKDTKMISPERSDP